MEIQAAFVAFMRSRKARGCTDESLTKYQRVIEGLAIPFWRDEDVHETDDLTVTHLEGFLAEARDRKLSTHTLHSYRIALSAFVNWCDGMGYCERGLMQRVGRIRPGARVYRIHSEEDILALLAFARLQRNPYSAVMDYAVLLMFMDTGMRVGELCNLNVGDLLSDGSVKLRGKGDNERYVAISPTTQEAVSRYLEHRLGVQPSAPLFTSARNGHRDRMTRHGIEQRVRKMGQRIGMQPCTPQRFRHTFAKMALENGANIKALQRFLGHQQLQTTDNYLQGIPDAQARADHEAFSPVRVMLQ